MGISSHITERDLADATSVTSQGSGHQFEIQLGHLCNNRCVFCSSGQLTGMKLARHIPLDPMIAAIEQAKEAGARRITFLGGEPTLHRGFLAALRRTVELGFEEVVIFTNGVLLPHPGFIDKVVAIGSFEWRISIQGANEAAHVAVTGRRDSFQRIVDGLALLAARGQRVTANMCVNEHSYRSLPEFPELIRKHGIRQLHVDIVRPSSTGERTEEYLREIMPRYSTMAPFMDDMLARFDEQLPGFDVSLGNLPFCILPKWAHRISHGGEETVTKACDETGLEVAVDKYEWHASMRRHVPQCERCAFRPDCTGIFATYLEMYGDQEFQPITVDQLSTAGHVERHFTIFAAPLEAAFRSEPPPGWTFAASMRDRRGQAIDLKLQNAAKRTVLLHFTAPRVAEGAERRIDQFRLELTADPEIADADYLACLQWIERRLHDVLALTIDQAFEIEALLVAHREKRLLARGRATVRQLIERVETRHQFGDWAVAGRHDEASGSVVELQRVGGGQVDMVFTIRLGAEHPRVTLDARPGADTTAATARSAVKAVAQALQGASLTVLGR